MIEVKDVHYSYSKVDHALRGASFTVPKGSWVSIIGHNGSGKSTIAKLLIGLLKPQTGEIKVDDIPLTEDTVSAIRKKIGVVFQNPDNQFVGITVKHDIAFGLENRRVPRSEMKELVYQSAKLVHMEDFLEREPYTLSGGQKQRVAIGGVLAMDAEYIIFDEATSMLDPNGVTEIIQIIQMLRKTTDKTIITITHDLNLAAQSDKILVMREGEIVLEGTPEQVFQEHDVLRSSNVDLPFELKLMNQIMLDEELKNNKDLVDAVWRYNLMK